MYGPEEFAQGQPSGVSESGHWHHHGFEDVKCVTDTPEHNISIDTTMQMYMKMGSKWVKRSRSLAYL